jgi:hypothetical protein
MNHMSITPIDARWKTVIVRSLVWGVGCGLAIAGAFSLWLYLSQRPKQWDTKALVAGKVTLSPDWATLGAAKDNPTADQNQHILFFHADIKNATENEVSFKEPTRIFRTIKGSSTLQPLPVSNLDFDAVLPAGHTTVIPLYVGVTCLPPNVEQKDCIQHVLGDTEQVIVFDDRNKFEIHIPISAALADYLKGQ